MPTAFYADRFAVPPTRSERHIPRKAGGYGTDIHLVPLGKKHGRSIRDTFALQKSALARIVTQLEIQSVRPVPVVEKPTGLILEKAIRDFEGISEQRNEKWSPSRHRLRLH